MADADIATPEPDAAIAARLLSDTDFLPDAAFIASLGDTDGKAAYPASHLSGWTELYTGSLEDKVREATPLADVEWTTLFAYMHRRFGPPNEGGDTHKDFSAGWFLTTPDPDVFVLVRPTPTYVWRMLSPHLACDAEPRDKYGPTDPRVHRIAAAYRATLLDMLRPVYVNDVPIDARGEVGADRDAFDIADGIPGLDDMDDDAQHDALEVYDVDPHPTCGMPIPAAMVDGDGWGDLCALASRLGDGDLGKGRDLANAILAEAVLARRADAPREARVLARARMSVLRRPDMAGRIPLDDAGMAEADDLSRQLRTSVGEGGGHPILSEANVAASGAIMADVGMRDGIAKGISDARFGIARDALYQRVMDSLGDAGTPSLVPSPDNDAASFSALLRGQSHAATADIVDEALSTEEGASHMRVAMHWISYHLRKGTG